MVTIDPVTNKVEVNSELLKSIALNVKKTGTERIAIVSVMGAYRTGKSFLLDLFLRYLRSVSKDHSEKLASEAVASDAMDHSDSRPGHVIPRWLTREGDMIVEGGTDDKGSKGFQWRGGMDKCTQGIWIWSEPFVMRDRDGPDEEPVAVLLLDSQGAFDSQMTKEQSATIFGLTAVLSSLQIYNISMQLQEDKIESLHYFMECAGSCVRLLAGDNKMEPKLFQRLEFLVRDWPNFETSWDVNRCEAQMHDHLIQHFEKARDRTTPDAIKSMFEDVSCWMLPHPGLKINKVGWNGNVFDLDPEFLRFLDEYVQRVFGSRLRERIVLGKPLTASTFVPVIETFVNAFVDLVPKGTNLATAIARSSNLMSKEEAIGVFKSEMEKGIASEKTQGLRSEDLTKLEKKCRASALDRFIKQTTFGSTDERESVKVELVSELDRLTSYYEVENRRRMESALTTFAGLALFAFFLYAMDKISDFTCDWYSDTCVRVSNALFLIYFTIIVAILTNVYLLYQSRGQAVVLVAIIEMGKSSITLMGDYFRSLKAIVSDWKESKSDTAKEDVSHLGRRIMDDIKQGLHAVHNSLTTLISGRSNQ